MKQWLFHQIHSRNLIYNQCWEDPRVDREALNIHAGDSIVMITSAGCNALDYLLCSPARINCVDLNPHQTALLELKLAALDSLPYEDFFELFGVGKIKGHWDLYNRCLRARISPQSRAIWDRRIDFFSPNGPGLYFHGTAGFFARLFGRYIDWRPTLREDLKYIQTLTDLGEQADFYRRVIAPQLWTPVVRWALRQPLTMSLLGVPAEQMRQIHRTAAADLSDFVQSRVDRVFTTIPIAENYFWRVYMNGCYTADCCPGYLKRENFEILQARSSRIHASTDSLSRFLKRSTQKFTVYVLLDHMDWLTGSRTLLQDEWNAILETAEPGARIIYRSGGTSFNHIPEFARERMEYRPDITEALHPKDRVGTYGSFYLASVRV